MSHKWIFLVNTGQQIEMDFVIMLLLREITVSFLGCIYGCNDVQSGRGGGIKLRQKDHIDCALRLGIKGSRKQVM